MTRRTRDQLDKDMRQRPPGTLRSNLRYWIVMGAVLVIAIAATVAIRNTNDLNALGRRVAADEHQTCIIQARGLPAGHQLAASMSAIYALLTLPPVPGAKAQTPPNVERIILALDAHLAAYLKAEAKQPAHRIC